MKAPYVDLQSPDWAVRAALAIAQDLCDRHGIQDEMQRLDRDMRHEMIVHQAHLIRTVWLGEIGPMMEDLTRRALRKLEPQLIERLEGADAFSRAVHRLRPDCWHVAMIDAHGPGNHQPPPEPPSRT